MWAVSLVDDPATAIGTICYWRIQPENYRAEIGYVLHPAYWRKGIMKESLQRVIQYGFENMKLHSIEARISAGNVASAAILAATGFVKEAHLKEEFFSEEIFTIQLFIPGLISNPAFQPVVFNSMNKHDFQRSHKS
jgi:ribosomal-protein-alanine N-acetyltransferase